MNDINRMMLDAVFETANEATMEAIKDGTISIEDEVIPHFLRANLSSNPQILKILECLNEEIMEDDGKYFVSFFLNKVRELANKHEDEF